MGHTKLFISPRMKLKLELEVYNIADQFWDNYEGGLWNFCEEGNFWFPCCQSVNISNTYNYFEGEMTPRSAGIAFCMMACSNLSIEYFKINSLLSKYCAEHYYFLRSYAFDSENFSKDEQEKIFKFLD